MQFFQFYLAFPTIYIYIFRCLLVYRHCKKGRCRGGYDLWEMFFYTVRVESCFLFELFCVCYVCLLAYLLLHSDTHTGLIVPQKIGLLIRSAAAGVFSSTVHMPLTVMSAVRETGVKISVSGIGGGSSVDVVAAAHQARKYAVGQCFADIATKRFGSCRHDA